jgi:sugar phosphate isomerase/epimerase
MSRIAACSWSLRTESPDALADALTRCGINAVQLALVPCIEQPAVWGTAIERLRARGITVVSGMLATVGEDYSTLQTIERTGGVRPAATWAQNESLARATAAIAGDHGVPLVTLHAGFLPHDRHDAERAAMIARLRTVADIFAARGVDVTTLSFSAAFGRNLDYYTGAVFEIRDARRPEAPPLVGGGRYDRLLQTLGAERAEVFPNNESIGRITTIMRRRPLESLRSRRARRLAARLEQP